MKRVLGVVILLVVALLVVLFPSPAVGRGP
jgi:hypothetical protein